MFADNYFIQKQTRKYLLIYNYSNTKILKSYIQKFANDNIFFVNFFDFFF